MIGSLGQLNYVELPLGPLDATRVEAVWRYEPSGAAAGTQLVLPDGRMDLVVHCNVEPDGTVSSVWPVIAGPADLPARASFRSDTVIFGARFQIGWGGACLGVDPVALRNRTMVGGRVELLLGLLADEMLSARSLQAVESALRSVVGALAARAPTDAAHRMALDAIAMLKGHARHGFRSGGAQADRSSRTLRRHMVAIAGFPLRTLTGILRFQQAMAILETDPSSLSEVALAAGYTDQSHMTREFRRFGGFTPSVPGAAPVVRLALHAT